MKKDLRYYRRLAGKLAAVAAMILCLGIGKANCMLFVGLKRAPGFSHTLFVKTAESPMGVLNLDDEMKANFSYILFSYCERTGATFLRRT